jgi:hypothetical protein
MRFFPSPKAHRFPNTLRNNDLKLWRDGYSFHAYDATPIDLSMQQPSLANVSDQATASVNGTERHSLSKTTRRAPPAGGGNTLLTRQIAFEPLPASVLFALVVS